MKIVPIPILMLSNVRLSHIKNQIDCVFIPAPPHTFSYPEIGNIMGEFVRPMMPIIVPINVSPPPLTKIAPLMAPEPPTQPTISVELSSHQQIQDLILTGLIYYVVYVAFNVYFNHPL